MKGTPEEEIAKGSFGKYEALELIHKYVKPEKYLEIGVQKGRSLALSKCISVGVDPAPRVSFETNATIYKMTSDDFFKQHKFRPDLAFIDGMHLFENVLSDFINVEKNSHKDTIILIDDIFPAHPAQALRIRRTTKWCGDVWKIVPALSKYRPDLEVYKLNTSPTGMLLVCNLSPANSVLASRYEDLLEWKNSMVPDWIINREQVEVDAKALIYRIFSR